MDIGATELVSQVTSGATQYLSVYSPVFLLIGGIILAIGIVGVLISFVSGKKMDVFDEDDII
jgi:hypothetical protein